jgi:hypothetical protein
MKTLTGSSFAPPNWASSTVPKCGFDATSANPIAIITTSLKFISMGFLLPLSDVSHHGKRSKQAMEMPGYGKHGKP